MKRSTPPLKDKINILFLCSKPSGYLFDSINKLVDLGHKIEVLHYDVSLESPFLIKDAHLQDYTRIITRRNTNFKGMLEKVCKKPNAVLVAGWSDFSYLKMARHFHRKGIMTVMMSDTPWCGKVKQWIMTHFFAALLRRIFTHVWVPGRKQYEYVRRMGFRHSQILNGLYTANHRIFSKELPLVRPINQKVLLYLGRLVPYKGIDLIFKAYSELRPQEKNGWNLVVAGNGPLATMFEYCPSDIKYIPFVQPREAARLMANSDAFILASDKENWGVSVHEAAASGLALILTEGVGASEEFLIDGYNGYLINSRSVSEIIRVMKKLFKMNTEDLVKMKRHSYNLSNRINNEVWSATLISAITRYYDKEKHDTFAV